MTQDRRLRPFRGWTEERRLAKETGRLFTFLAVPQGVMVIYRHRPHGKKYKLATLRNLEAAVEFAELMAGYEHL